MMILAFALAAAAPSDFDWHREADLMSLDGAFDAIATGCSRDLGFTRQPRQPAAVMAQKMKAHLLLQASAEFQLQGWLDGIIRPWNELKDKAKDEAFLDRVADPLEAAARDPDSYAQAEALYVSRMMEPMRKVLSACQSAAQNPFIGKYYLTGAGSVDAYEERAKARFKRDVEDLRKDLQQASER